MSDDAPMEKPKSDQAYFVKMPTVVSMLAGQLGCKTITKFDLQIEWPIHLAFRPDRCEVEFLFLAGFKTAWLEFLPENGHARFKRIHPRHRIMSCSLGLLSQI